MTTIKLGNLSISQFEERTKVKLSAKDVKWLNEHRQQSARAINDDEFHIFDIPFRFICGLEIYEDLLKMLRKYNFSKSTPFGIQGVHNEHT